MKALILAAGYGTRLAPFTDHIPKPLFPIDGQPAIDRIIHQLARSGCQSVMVNTHHLSHQIEAHLKSTSYPITVYTRYEKQILGTGGAIGNVADFWGDTSLMVVNSDIVADVDFKGAYEQHRSSDAAASLLMHDHAEYNTVRVDENGFIIGFDTDATQTSLLDERTVYMAFTGVQVVEPLFLEFAPEERFFSSIDVYRRLIKEGHKVKALVRKKLYWYDIGTPSGYLNAAADQQARNAFEHVYNEPCTAPTKTPLKGDGSDRCWARLTSQKRSLIMVSHGIQGAGPSTEVNAFVSIGRHLLKRGIRVPRLYRWDLFSGLVCMEDLGDCHLEKLVRGLKTNEEIERRYHSIIETLIKLSFEAVNGFDLGWTMETQRYDQQLIIDKECRYFVGAFLLAHLGLEIDERELMPEFKDLAEQTLRHGVEGLMHRDFQSRNIMIKNGKDYLIDFQGARLGPIQYDLASLLIDPYVNLPDPLQRHLLDYAIDRTAQRTTFSKEKIRMGYNYCRLTRNLQMLGAFGFLARKKGKRQFLRYMPAALETLKRNLCRGDTAIEFPLLTALVDGIDTNSVVTNA
jgi:NDP-sugar pyrophosphorylase family protein